MRYKLYFLFVLVLFSSISYTSAVPKIVPYVNDFADVLTPEQELNLNLELDTIEKNTTYEIAIVTVPNTEGQERVEYANRIGDENGVGKKELSNGIVVLWSLDNEKGGAIGTGRGSEPIFNDAKVGRIGRDSEDYFFNGSYYEGFQIIITELSSEIKNTNSTGVAKQNLEFNWYWFLPFIFVILFSILRPLLSNDNSHSNYFPTSYGKKKRKKDDEDEDESSSSSSSSSWGFSSGGFGGGSFGGGGASFGR